MKNRFVKNIQSPNAKAKSAGKSPRTQLRLLTPKTKRRRMMAKNRRMEYLQKRTRDLKKQTVGVNGYKVTLTDRQHKQMQGVAKTIQNQCVCENFPRSQREPMPRSSRLACFPYNFQQQCRKYHRQRTNMFAFRS